MSQQYLSSSSIAQTVCIGSIFASSYKTASRLVLGSSATMGDKQISVGKLEEYVDALEKERRKIEVFQRELPLCMQLVAHGN